MSLLVAALGPLDKSGWLRLVLDLRPFGSASLRESSDPDGRARLGIVGSSAPVRVVDRSGTSAEAIAAGIGSMDDGGAVAEACLHAYRRDGASGLGTLRGSYAFVLWAGREQSFYVGCDVVGLRAPAYRWDGRTFLLSSRAAALLRYSEQRPAWNRTYLASALGGVWSAAADATAFGGVRRMAAGELLRVSADGVERFAGEGLRFEPLRSRDRAEAIHELGARLDRAVRSRFRPIETCVATSGGLDSSMVGASLAAIHPDFDALSLVAAKGGPSGDSAVAEFRAAFPRVRWHGIELGGDSRPPLPVLVDDPIVAAPALQPGRAALFRAARELGFRRIIDGEGGDELFDLAFWPRDLIRERAFGPVVARLLTKSERPRILAEVAMSSSPRLASAWWARVERQLRRRRPWLRETFWNGAPFAEAWAQFGEYGRLAGARERLPFILGSHGRYGRAQELSRMALGLEGASPLLDRGVVELVGSMDAAIMLDTRHGKVLLRQLAARRMPAPIAWRPKREPLHEWLVERFIADDARIDRGLGFIRRSSTLVDAIDTSGVIAAVARARTASRPTPAAHAVVELLTVAEWIATVEQNYRF